MAERSTRLSRRAFGAALIGGATLVAGHRVLAQQGPRLTPESPMGPFFPVRIPADHDADLVQVAGRSGRAQGQVIEVTGRVLDRHGNPVRGAQLDLWQANAAGRYTHPADISTAPLDPNFEGFARIRTDAQGDWRVTTIMPGGYDSPIGHRPPHLHFDISGQSHRLVAQMYFPDQATANAADRLYRALGEEGPLSVAERTAANRYRWNVVLLEG